MGVETILARQPIIDAGHQLLGYELLFRHSMESTSAEFSSPLQAGVDVINNTLCIGTQWVLHGKLAFINLDESTLMSDFITLLPAGHVVFEILETVRVTPVLVARLSELRQLGYRFALDDFVALEEYRPLMGLIDFIKLDVLQQPLDKTGEIVAMLRQDYKGKFIAEKVETMAMFLACKALRMDYFQGYYFSRPENLAGKTIHPGQLAVLELMNKVRVCEDIGEIEDLLRRDAALTLRLLRYVNSAGIGLGKQVHNVRQALAVIGLRPLYRWLSLLLVAACATPTTTLLARMAVIRGRICELLGAGRVSRAEQDDLFMTGLFSLVEPLLGVPLDTLLEQFPLPDTIVSAIRRGEGPYAPFLKLAEGTEAKDFARLDACRQEIGIAAEELVEVELRAMAWAEAFEQEMATN